MQAGEGLHPSSKGARVRFSGKNRTVIDGPFSETKELVAGFWIWQCASLQEAIAWAKRCPNPMPGDSELEIRQVFAAEDFGEAFTPELREQEERLRAQVDKSKFPLTIKPSTIPQPNPKEITMPKMIFVNLPVKDLAAAKRFYKAIGCEQNMQFSNEQAAMMVWSEAISFMLLTHDYFATFTSKRIADAQQTCEVLLALSRDSREEVDSITKAAAAAGGKADVRPPQTWALCIPALSRTRTAMCLSRCGWTWRRRKPLRR
jgi:predicted lactoylglutathione lyase